MTLVKANALAEIVGNEVYVVVTDNWATHIVMEELSAKVHFIDLGINYYKDDWKSVFHRLKSNLKIFKHFHRLQRQIDKIKPDIIVSVGQGEKYIIPWLRTNAIKIREIHFNSTYRLYTYSKKWIARLLNFFDYHLNAKGYDRIILLTKEDKITNFPNDDRYTYMYNPLTFGIQDSYKPRLSHTVIAVGRLEQEKDFASLIRTWKMVYQKAPDWVLNIFGEGVQKERLSLLIKDLKLESCVHLKGYTNHVCAEMGNSSFFVLSSLFEGFGIVISEAMACGLPVVSFACPFGPRDIIQDGINGFLVEGRDEKIFANRIIQLIQDEDLRIKMGKAALERAGDFDISVIVKKWMDLFEEEFKKSKK